MKKLAMTLLTATILCTTSMSPLAASVDTTGETSKKLIVSYSRGTGTGSNPSKIDTYAATVAWTDMKFTYTGKTEKWDASKMCWVTDSAAHWSEAKNITVSNKSSVEIIAEISLTLEDDKKDKVVGISITPTNATAVVGVDNKYKIEAATAGTATENGTATTATFAILPTGSYEGSENTEIGSITVTLS